MKLSRTARYAIRAVAYIARQNSDQSLVGHEVASALKIPEGFLLRILVDLSRSRILTSVKGPNGGYRLARAASKISLLDIIEAVEGPMNGPVAWGGALNLGAGKTLDSIIKRVTQTVRAHFAGISVADLAARSSKSNRTSSHV